MKKIVKRKNLKVKINNRIKAFGEEQNGVITLNLAKHKGNAKELADTVFHESYHAKHPAATEKKTYQVTKKAMKVMPLSEKEKLAAKVKTNHYAQGALKRKFKMGRVHLKTGDLITRMNESKSSQKQTNKPSLRRIAVDGMV